MDSPSVRVLRNRVVESKDGVSTPTSKLSTPSKRGTPSRVAGEASGITTRTRRRLSTKLENENLVSKLEPSLIMTRLSELETSSRRGDKNVSESDKSPVSQEKVTTRSPRKDSKKDEMSPSGSKRVNQSASSPQNKKVLFKDESPPVTDKKGVGDLSPIKENGVNSNPFQSDNVLLKNQSSPKAHNKIKGDLPPILENRDDCDDSIIERSSQLELNVTDKTKSKVQNSPSKSPLVEKSPSKSNREESMTQVKKLEKISPVKSVIDLGPLKPLQSDMVSEEECGFIVQEETISNESVGREEETIESVEQEEESSKSVDKDGGTSKTADKSRVQTTSVHQENVESNESVDQKEETSQFSNQEESGKSITQENTPSEIANLQEECSKSIENESSETILIEKESSETIFIEKESNKSVDKVDESVCLGECDTADSTLNSMETTKNNSSPSKEYAKDSEGDSHVLYGIVEEVEELKGDNSMNISIEENSKSKNESFELVEKFQDSFAVNRLQNDTYDDTMNFSQSVPVQLGSKQLCDSPPLKVAESRQSFPSEVCSPEKHSLPFESSPLCQRLPDEKKSPSKVFEIIGTSPDKLVSNKDDGEKISDSNSDSDDSDSLQDITYRSISKKISPRNTNSEHSIIKSTPSPNKVLKIIKPVQSEKLYKMKNLIKNTYETLLTSNEVKNQAESQNATSIANADLDELRISRKELTLMMKEMIKPMMKEAIDEAFVELRKDVHEMRKELSNLKTLTKKEKEEKAELSKEENMDELSIVKWNKNLVVEQLLAKQAAQIFSDSDSPSKKKKSPKKNKESTQETEDKTNNSGSESCSTHQPKLKKRKIMEIDEEEIEGNKNIEEGVVEDDNFTTSAEVHKKRKRKRKTTAIKKNEETAIEPTHYVDVEPIEEIYNCQDGVESELKPKKKKRSRKSKNKDKETQIIECADLSQVNSTDMLENLSKESKSKNQSILFNKNSLEDCMSVDKLDHHMIIEEKKEKKQKKKNAEQMDEVSFKNAFSFNLDLEESKQPTNEEKKKKKKKHVEQTDELNLHQSQGDTSPILDSNEFVQQSLYEVKKKKKKHVKHLEQITSPDQNPVFGQLHKIKKQKLKKNLKPKSNFNISQQHLKSYMEEFCDFKPKDKVKSNSFEDGINEVLKSKDNKKLKKKNKGSVNDSSGMETIVKDVKHSKREAKDSSHKLTPSTNLDVTNFWL